MSSGQEGIKIFETRHVWRDVMWLAGRRRTKSNASTNICHTKASLH